MLTLNQSRLLKRLFRLKNNLHWGSVLLKKLYKLDLKFKERAIKRSYLGTVIEALLGTKM